ncbi:MAG: hypothetical protein Q8R88_08710 [Desulfoprunum sp.]|nr:hypothetical protein [Desulfoprunum sp.]
MIGLWRSFMYGLIAIISLIIVAIGPAAAGEIGKHNDLASWQTYANTDANFTFRYPKDWEIADDDFYETAGGAIANQRSVTLQTIGGDKDSDNWIRINQRQFDDSDGICKEVGEEKICTYSTDPDVLDILNKIVSSFILK